MGKKFSSNLRSNAQAAYSDLLNAIRQEDLKRSIENLSGSFSKKTVHGIDYWYYQAINPVTKGLKQVFVGPDDEKVRALVSQSKTRDHAPAIQLARSAIALGCAATPPVHYRIIRRLNETGIFRAGGVLVGSHAFVAHGNELGVAWADLAEIGRASCRERV